MYAPIGFVNRAQLSEVVNQAISQLGQNVVRVRYNVAEDNGGDPAIYFRVVLSDEASQVASLGLVANNVSDAHRAQIRPYENWGLFPYFSFRSKSEHAMNTEPEWS